MCDYSQTPILSEVQVRVNFNKPLKASDKQLYTSILMPVMDSLEVVRFIALLEYSTIDASYGGIKLTAFDWEEVESISIYTENSQVLIIDPQTFTSDSY